MKHYYLVLFFISQFSFIFAQETKHTISCKNKSAIVVLNDIETKYGVHFSYLSNLLADKSISLNEQNATLDEILLVLSIKLNVQFNKIKKGYYYIIAQKIVRIDEVILVNYLTQGITKKQDGSFTINSQDTGQLPGLTEPDVLEQIQQLPGVISLTEKAGEFSVRGGVADENSVLWDGMNMYQTTHFFGLIAAFNPAIPKDVLFYYKGTNARFGEKISSTVVLETKNKFTKKTKGSVGINGISLDTWLTSPLIKNKLQLQVAARRSYMDLLKTPTFKKLEEKVYQNTSITNSDFNFLDATIKLVYQINKKNKVSASTIHIDNKLKTTNDTIATSTNGVSLSWLKKWDAESYIKTQINHTNYNLAYQNSISNYNKENTISDVVFKTAYFEVINTKNKISLGYQATSKEVFYTYNRNNGQLRDYNTTKLYTYSGFTNYTYTSPEFDFYGGLRTTYYTLLNSFRLEPRLLFNTKITPNLTYQFTGEIKNQVINQLDETVYSDLSLDTKLWHLLDGRKYPLLHSIHLTSGFVYTKNNWTADIDLYWKKTTGLAALSLGYLNLNDPSIHLGNKKIKGITFYVKKQANLFNYWMTYSYLDSKTRFKGLNNDEYFTSNNGIKHNLNTVISCSSKKIDIALGWKISSGKPITNYRYDSNNNIIFEGINTNRLPVFHRLDLAVDYKFMLAQKSQTKAKIGLSLRNIYNNKSLIGLVFTGNDSINEPVAILEQYAIGFTPNFSFRVNW